MHCDPGTACEQIALSEPESLSEFLADVERRALRMAEIATGSRDEALDVVQDCMLKLVERYGDRPATEWAPLFHRILQHRIMDWYRRDTVRRRWRTWFSRDDDGGEDPLEQVADRVSPQPLAALVQDDSIRALESALRDLPLRQQQTFLLRCWEGLDTAATAKAMGCSEGTVKTHYSRALQALRGKLQETDE